MSVIDRALNLLAPHICMVCEEEGNPVCNSCQIDIATPLPSSCFLCNTATSNFLTCFSCRRKTVIRHAWTASEYSPEIKDIISKLKFERVRALAKPVAEIMHAALPYFDEIPLVSYVPTATSRARVRGYDHAELLSKELAIKLGSRSVRLIARTNQHRQVGSDRITRRKQSKTAYRAVRSTQANGRRILLVDDVSTTGASLSEAARVLKRAGARSVDSIVLARKL